MKKPARFVLKNINFIENIKKNVAIKKIKNVKVY